VTRSAESYENEIRYWKQMAYSLNQRIQAQMNTPEQHSGRGQFRDKTGDTAARNVDNQRKKRN
jgi:hypothetical protein